MNRMTGPYAPLYWFMIACNVVIPQVLWSKRVRSNALALWGISIVVNIGMWLERFVIVITSLAQDFLPSSWHLFTPTIWDWATYLGTLGLFFFLFLLFVRFVPVISMFETKELLAKLRHGKSGASH